MKAESKKKRREGKEKSARRNRRKSGKRTNIESASNTRSVKPPFLNLDEPYPRQVSTFLIWGSDRPKFGDPEAKYGNKKICVTGAIKSYRGVAENVASEPAQIEIQK